MEKTSHLPCGDGVNIGGSSEGDRPVGISGIANGTTIANKNSYTMQEKLLILEGASHIGSVKNQTMNDWKHNRFFIYAANKLGYGDKSVIVSIHYS